MPVVTPSLASMDSVKAVPKLRSVLRRHLPEAQVLQPLLGHGQADQAASVLGHEVDGFGRDLLGGHRQVAFVLAVLVVDDHDHAAGADLLQRGLDIAEWGMGRHDGLMEILAGKRIATRSSLFALRSSPEREARVAPTDKQVPRLRLRSSLGMTASKSARSLERQSWRYGQWAKPREAKGEERKANRGSLTPWD